MSVEIERQFDVSASPEEVWRFLVDPHRVVECLPGAEIRRRIDDRSWEGEMGVELGPVGVTFQGTIRFERIDEEAREVTLSGSGESASGAGRVRMEMQGRVDRLEEGGTRILLRQELDLGGRISFFARGGVIRGVADVMIGRFTRCVEQRLAGSTAPAADR